jgi:phosphopantothenoylcysteine decarboxylase/phosphopantothenate--cysteine ligase
VSEKRVLLIVGGGIAAYKALELVRLLRKAGVGVRPILTKAGAEFVTPLSLSALAEDKVYQRPVLADRRGRDGPYRAVALGRPGGGGPGDRRPDRQGRQRPGRRPGLHHPAGHRQAGADGPGHERADVAAPGHPAQPRDPEGRRRPLRRSRRGRHGLRRVRPRPPGRAAGDLRGDHGAALAGPAARPLAGKHALVTAGPTFEPIDPVRGITNRSSGKQGYAIAEALAKLGARGHPGQRPPVALPTPPGVDRVDVETAREMLAACQAALPADVGVFVAAVADWRIDEVFGVKLKKDKGGPPALTFVENPDILATLSASGPEAPEAGDRLRGRDQRCRGPRPRQAGAQGLRLDHRQRRHRARRDGRRRERRPADLQGQDRTLGRGPPRTPWPTTSPNAHPESLS